MARKQQPAGGGDGSQRRPREVGVPDERLDAPREIWPRRQRVGRERHRADREDRLREDRPVERDAGDRVRGGVRGMRVDHARDVGASLVDSAVKRDLRGRLSASPDFIPVHDDEIPLLHGSLAAPRWSDEKQISGEARGEVAVRRGEDPFRVEAPRNARQRRASLPFVEHGGSITKVGREK